MPNVAVDVVFDVDEKDEERAASAAYQWLLGALKQIRPADAGVKPFPPQPGGILGLPNRNSISSSGTVVHVFLMINDGTRVTEPAPAWLTEGLAALPQTDIRVLGCSNAGSINDQLPVPPGLHIPGVQFFRPR